MTFRFRKSARRPQRRRDPDAVIRAFWRTLERFAGHERTPSDERRVANAKH
jgi:hypothetical protein